MNDRQKQYLEQVDVVFGMPAHPESREFGLALQGLTDTWLQFTDEEREELREHSVFTAVHRSTRP